MHFTKAKKDCNYHLNPFTNKNIIKTSPFLFAKGTFANFLFPSQASSYFLISDSYLYRHNCEVKSDSLDFRDFLLSSHLVFCAGILTTRLPVSSRNPEVLCRSGEPCIFRVYERSPFIFVCFNYFGEMIGLLL